jgi:dolichol-phosphate mannosyltransferase
VATIQQVVEQQLEQLELLGIPFELLIIDDGSSDGTAATADRLAEPGDRVRVIHHPANQGLGGVYRTAFREARGEFVTFFPADGQFPPSILGLFYPMVESWDMVLGNLPGRRNTPIGALLGRIERLLYRIAVGRMPRLEGVFIFRRSILSELPLKSAGRGWTVVWELILRAERRGYRIAGCPITMLPRTHGVSKVNNVRNVAANLRQLASLRRLLKD